MKKPTWWGPLESDSYWLVTMAEKPALIGSLRYRHWVFLGWLVRKYNTWIMTAAPNLHFSTLFSCVGIHGRLKDPRTLLGGWRGVAKGRGQHQGGLRRGCGPHAAQIGSLQLFMVARCPGSSSYPVAGPCLIRKDETLGRTTTLVHGILLWIWY